MTKTRIFSLLTLLALAATGAQAELKLPSIIGDHMVLQRDQAPLPIWGWAAPGTEVTVEIAGQKVSGKAGDDGRWEVKLAALKTNADGLGMKITAGSETISLKDILVGEVWVCSGQSNMQWSVAQSYDADLTALSANHPNIRLISVPQVGTQEIQNDFEGQWDKATPETVPQFSAVGFYFGRILHQTLGVPVGLIDNAWGGSAAEAWVKRDVLEADPNYAEYIAQWEQTEATFDYDAAMAKWKAAVEKAKAEGKPNRPRPPRNVLAGQHRPGNLYAGVLHPIIGYGIRGTIWYQGESNAGRAWNYRELFPKMITHWREEWGQGDFPFYWVQLADFKAEVDQPADHEWPVLREAQTHALKLPNTGQAVIYDIGEGRDIHPRDKEGVAKRLARLALKNDYGFDIAAESPRYKSHEVKGNKIEITFDHVGKSGLYTFDVREAVGFQIAGEDKVFHWADAQVVGKDKVVVSSKDVPNPVAVRYAWTDNPVANLCSRENLPVVPFRTDDWKVATMPE
ncbi:MAG: sialate O-acetylesterase [Verrucomicrobiales bacterium]|nr:sialate O-acetylesterase [Verrucomicrobiales bacterium]